MVCHWKAPKHVSAKAGNNRKLKSNSALLTAVAVLGWGTVAHYLWLAAARLFIYPRSLDPHQT